MTKFILLTERRPSRLTQSTSDIEAWDDKMPALSQLLPPSKSANLVRLVAAAGAGAGFITVCH
jgi:hypothetical protein